ncbi:MAG: hypothetical protein ABIF08_00115 [Nanoarchaeota archaeon]
MVKPKIDKVLLLLTSCLAVYFAIRIIDFSKIISYFPVHVTGDIPSYMAQLFFLSEYGFHQIVPYWFNGMVLFLRYPPGWYYFTLPIYQLTKSITLATYISITTIFLLIFIALYQFGKVEKISKVKRVAFFFFMFGNGIAVGNFLRLGRVTELFGWLWFITTMAIILYYKDHRVNLKFFWIIPAYAMIILSHPPLTIFFNILCFFPMLFLIKKSIYEKIIVVLSMVAGLIASAFWWVPFVLDNLKNNVLSNNPLGKKMLGLEDQPLLNFILNNIATSSICILLWASFYVYWQHKNKSKRELLFFSPLLILSLLFFLRISLLLPLANIVYSDIYAMGFLFFSLYFLFKTPLRKRVKIIFLVILTLFVIGNVGISILHTPWFPTYTQVEYNTFSLLQLIQGKFLMINSPYPTSYPHAYYCYASVYYKVSTPFGMGTEGFFPSYLKPIQEITQSINSKNCENTTELAEKIELTEIITYDDSCDLLKNCGFEEIKTNKPACLYKIR